MGNINPWILQGSPQLETNLRGLPKILSVEVLGTHFCLLASTPWISEYAQQTGKTLTAMRPVIRYKQAPALHRVYCHRDPKTRRIVFVGLTISKSLNEAFMRTSIGRHKRWLKDRLAEGYSRSDILSIVKDELTRQDAINLKRSLIAKYKPRFNSRILRPDFDEKAHKRKRILQMAKEGLDVQFIADMLHMEFFEVHRIIDSARAKRNKQGFIID